MAARKKGATVSTRRRAATKQPEYVVVSARDLRSVRTANDVLSIIRKYEGAVTELREEASRGLAAMRAGVSDAVWSEVRVRVQREVCSLFPSKSMFDLWVEVGRGQMNSLALYVAYCVDHRMPSRKTPSCASYIMDLYAKVVAGAVPLKQFDAIMCECSKATSSAPLKKALGIVDIGPSADVVPEGEGSEVRASEITGVVVVGANLCVFDPKGALLLVPTRLQQALTMACLELGG